MARIHAYFAIVPAVLVFAPPAVAAPEGPRTLFGRAVHEAPEPSAEELERRRLALAENLEAQGLVLSGDVVMSKEQAEGGLSTPPGAPLGAWEEPPHRSTIFLNFFGGPLTGGKIASEGQSPCLGSPNNKVDYPAYSGSEQKALAVIQIFKDAAAPFGLRVAYENPPPKHLPYSQVMMGGLPSAIGFGNGILGVSCNLDCGDQWLRDTTFAFTEVSNNAGVLGTTALQEAAHSFGLDHIDGENNIMYPFATQGAKVWADGCTPYNDATGAIGCEYVHEDFCPVGSQDDVAELTAYFGLNTPDTEAPIVKMLSPVDGQQLGAGDPLHIEVEVSDNFLGYGWVLQVPELKQELQAYAGETVWDFPAPGQGVYTIRVEAIDHDGNIGFAEAKIYVDQEPPASETGDEPTTGDGESGGSDETGPSGSSGEGSAGSASSPGSESSDGESGNSGDADSADTTAMDDDKGCSCRNDAPTPGPAWLLVVGGALMLRRRRRSA
jgi:MYXO-CTERM domain-containing protein